MLQQFIRLRGEKWVPKAYLSGVPKYKTQSWGPNKKAKVGPKKTRWGSNNAIEGAQNASNS